MSFNLIGWPFLKTLVSDDAYGFAFATHDTTQRIPAQ